MNAFSFQAPSLLYLIRHPPIKHAIYTDLNGLKKIFRNS